MTEGSSPDNSAAKSPSLLSADEPAPFQVLNPHSAQAILLVCDHASCRFPESLGDLGLDPFARRCHLAVDIGAGPLTESLAGSLGVTAVLAQYSRLVVDCNRHLMDPSAFLEYGDGTVIPGNRNLHQRDKDQRATAIYHPYHDAVERQLARLQNLGPAPAFIAIHSFTPVMNGEARRWEFGVLWDSDEQLRDIFLHDLRQAGYQVGDNEPYSGKAVPDFTVDHHADTKLLPNCGIEVRQDLIDDDEGVEKIAGLMHKIIESIPLRLKNTGIGDAGKRTSIHNRG